MAILETIHSFEITIKRKTTTRFDTTAESLSEERHYTDKEREKDYVRWSADTEYTKKVYTQVPAIGTRTDDVTIFTQTVHHPEFDIKKVIGAINDLK